jgi:hypothetical protein
MLEGFLKPLTQEEARFMNEASRMSGAPATGYRNACVTLLHA